MVLRNSDLMTIIKYMIECNLDKLVKVECNDYSPSIYYQFKKEKKMV